MPIRGDIWGAFTAMEEEPMAHTALLNVTAKPGRGSAVISYYRATLSATRSRPGLIGLRVVRNMEDPTRFMLIEQWDSKADQAASAAWPPPPPAVLARWEATRGGKMFVRTCRAR